MCAWNYSSWYLLIAATAYVETLTFAFGQALSCLLICVILRKAQVNWWYLLKQNKTSRASHEIASKKGLNELAASSPVAFTYL